MNSLKTLLASVVALTTASAANAELSGSIQLQTQGQSMRWNAGVDGTTEWADQGYSFTGGDYGSGWGIHWNMMASGGASQSLLANFTVVNTSAETQTFQLIVSEAVAVAYGAGSFVGGSVAGTFADLNGNEARVTSIDGAALYTAFVDATELDPFNGTVVGSLLDGVDSNTGAFLSESISDASFGDFPTIPGQSFGGADVNFGFVLEFTLSAGDTAGFTAAMAVATPAPGVLAVFGMAGLARRRRRSAA